MEERQFHIKTLMLVVVATAIVCCIYRFCALDDLMFMGAMFVNLSVLPLVLARRKRLRSKNEALRKRVLIRRGQDQADDERFGQFGRSE